MLKGFTASSGTFAGGLFDFESEPGVSDSVKRAWVWQSDGDPLRVTVADVGEDTVTLDANHPLADCTVTFAILLVTVK